MKSIAEDEEGKVRSKNKNIKFKLENKAVWIHNNGIEFHNLCGGSSSILKEKKSGTYKETIHVDSIDCAEFLSKFNDHELYISCNIEGAEFEIIDHLLLNNIFDKIHIKKFFLDYHTNIQGKEDELKNKIKEQLNQLDKKFTTRRLRPYSGNPEDFLLIN
jgi:hypothetical protein